MKQYKTLRHKYTWIHLVTIANYSQKINLWVFSSDFNQLNPSLDLIINAQCSHVHIHQLCKRYKRQKSKVFLDYTIEP